MTHTHNTHTRVANRTNGCEHALTKPKVVSGQLGMTYLVDVCTYCGRWATPLVETSRPYSRLPTEQELADRKKGAYAGPQLKRVMERKEPKQRAKSSGSHKKKKPS